MKILNFGKKKESGGSLIGRIINLSSFQLRVDALIGEGGFASIYKVVETRSEHVFALKYFKSGGDPDAVEEIRTEVTTMQALSGCPEVLQLRAFAETESEGFLLLDYCQYSLPTHLVRHGSLSDDTILQIFEAICTAVHHMHSMTPPIVHRDLKAENILLHKNGKWVLCDFGSCTTKQGAYATPGAIGIAEDDIRKRTTPAYRAPEMWDLYSREFIGCPADIWALGCLLYLLCFNQLPFDGDSKLQILAGRYSEPKDTNEGFSAIIRACLNVKPLGRPSASSLLDALRSLRQGDGKEALDAALRSSNARLSNDDNSGSKSLGETQNTGVTRNPAFSAKAGVPVASQWASFSGSGSLARAEPAEKADGAETFLDSSGWVAFGGGSGTGTSAITAPSTVTEGNEVSAKVLPGNDVTASKDTLLDNPSGLNALRGLTVSIPHSADASTTQNSPSSRLAAVTTSESSRLEAAYHNAASNPPTRYPSVSSSQGPGTAGHAPTVAGVTISMERLEVPHASATGPPETGLEQRCKALELLLKQKSAELARSQEQCARQAEQIAKYEARLNLASQKQISDGQSEAKVISSSTGDLLQDLISGPGRGRPKDQAPDAPPRRSGASSMATSEDGSVISDRPLRGLSISSTSKLGGGSKAKGVFRDLTTPGCFQDLDPLG